MNLTRLTVILATILTLAGCASNNVKSYRPDHTNFNDFKRKDTGTIRLENVRMNEGDKNSILCRMVGNIYLPNKMTYSQYIQDAFNKTLTAIGKLDEDGQASHTLAVELTKVTFDSLSGQWDIDGNVIIDHKAPKYVTTSTKFGTSWIAEYACKNVADGFDEAVTQFVKRVLAEI